MLFWYLEKVTLVHSTLRYRTLDKSRSTRYQTHTAMHNWSPCGISPDQINMAVLFWYLEKVTLVHSTLRQPYTGQVTLYKVPDTHGHV